MKLQADLQEIRRFYDMLFLRYKIFGYHVLFLRKTKASCWVGSGDGGKLIEETARLGSDGDVYVNMAMQDRAMAERIYDKRNPGREFRGRGSQESACCVTCLFGDIDVAGPGHAQQDLPRTIEDALDFLDRLPVKPSMIVSSGGGIHFYICLSEAMNIEKSGEKARFKSLSLDLQKLVRNEGLKNGWKFDSVGDLSRMLRPAGTFNFKDPAEPKKVVILECHRDRVYEIAYLEDAFRSGSVRGDVASDRLIQDERGRVYGRFTDGQPEDREERPIFQDFYAEGIIEECPFIRHCRDDAVTLPEPEWFAAICVLAFCENGKPAVHAISRPYRGYSYRETENKIRHALEANAPRTCKNISEITGDIYCRDCEHRGKLHSPIKLGSRIE